MVVRITPNFSQIASSWELRLTITPPPLLSHKKKSWKILEHAFSKSNQIFNYPPAWQHHWGEAEIEPTTSEFHEQRPPFSDSLLTSVSKMAPTIKPFYPPDEPWWNNGELWPKWSCGGGTVTARVPDGENADFIPRRIRVEINRNIQTTFSIVIKNSSTWTGVSHTASIAKPNLE